MARSPAVIRVEMKIASRELVGNPNHVSTETLPCACRGDRSWRVGMPENDQQFFLDWRPGEPLPAAEEVAIFERPLHLRAPYHTVSLGHLIRDNLQFLVELPVRFGREPTDFDWVRCLPRTS